MISLSTARWILSLLSEQWWRERSADGVVIELLSHASLRACCRWRTPGWIGQWSLRSGSCRWSWAHNLWEDCCRPKCLLLIRGSAQCTSPRINRHGRWRWRSGEWKGRWARRWRVQNGESKRYQNAQPLKRMMTWRDADNHLEPMSRTTLKCVLWNTRKCDVWGCSVHTPRRLQQIAISCNRCDYNKFFFKKNRQKFHSEYLDE